MLPSVLTVDDLQQALARCMKAHPPEGLERALHHDADLIAGPWALMMYERIPSVVIEELTPGVLDAYRRWSIP